MLFTEMRIVVHLLQYMINEWNAISFDIDISN